MFFRISNALILIVTALLVAATAYSNKLPQVSGDFTTLYPRSSPTLENLTLSETIFGAALDDVVVVTLPEDGNLEEIESLQDDFLTLAELDQVISPYSKQSAGLKMTSDDQKHARLLLSVSADLSVDEQRGLHREINEIIGKHTSLNAIRTGLFAVSQSVAEVVHQETLRLVPLSALIFLGILTAVFRSFMFSIFVLCAPLLSTLWVVLAYGLLDRSFGPISQLLPSFLISVGTSYSVQVATRLLESAQVDYARTKQEVRKAVGLAALTTIIGLLSLLLLDVQGVTDFAIAASAGVILASWFSLSLTAALTAHWRKQKAEVIDRKLYPLDPVVFSTRSLVYLLGAAALALAPGFFHLSFSTNPSDFLEANSPQRAAIASIKERFPGIEILSLVIQPDGKSSKAVLTDKQLQLLSVIKAKILSINGVHSVICASDFQHSKLKHTPSGFEYGPTSITASDRTASRLLIESNLSGRPLLQLAKKIQTEVSVMSTAVPELSSLQMGLSSPSLLILEQAEQMLRGVLYSLGITLITVALLLAYLFRSFRVVIIGLLPNVIPIAAVFGAIGHLGLEVSVGVAIAGATALSIAVDDTFHLLVSWEASKKTGIKCAWTAVRKAFSALLTTTLVLSTGFFILLISGVQPIREYGMVVGCLLLVALTADIVMLPYLLSKLTDSQENKPLANPENM